ncbi:MAG: transposase [Mangrovibacterium sp.]
MEKVRKKTGINTISRSSTYKAESCNECNVKEECYKGEDNRQVLINHNLNRHKQKVRKLLTSEEGLKKRSRRPIEPEAVFGQIKNNMGYKRFKHTGKDNALMDFGILSIAFNLKKLHKRMQLGLKTAFETIILPLWKQNTSKIRVILKNYEYKIVCNNLMTA